jgi:hypothetical protein
LSTTPSAAARSESASVSRSIMTPGQPSSETKSTLSCGNFVASVCAVSPSRATSASSSTIADASAMAGL